MIRYTTPIAAVALTLLFSCGTHAASIVGTIGFNVKGQVTQSPLDLTPAMAFTNVRTNNTSTGDWVAFNSMHQAGGLLVTPLLTVGRFNSEGTELSFQSEEFGEFLGTVVDDGISSFVGPILSVSTRHIQAIGRFRPGSVLSQAGFGNSVAAMVSILMQGFSGTEPTARSSSVTMATQPIPEPSTAVIAVLGLAGFAATRLRRKRP
jgi:hypothetical protein